MSKIIPISITTAEQAVTLDATYQFAWFRNMGDNDCLFSDHSDIVQGDENVTLVKAGESGRIATSGRAVYIKTVDGTSTGEIHAQNFSDAPFKSKAKGGGQSITVEPLTVNDNGVYTAPTGKAYSPVSVDVQEEPWEPLQDGYSNFWFELTNDTLSPWLNFSAKTESAVIDWGDGSGEQALTTLTPTHTYSKAGRYIVKAKGVTGIARQLTTPYTDATAYYNTVLKNVELSNEVRTLSPSAFWNCGRLENFVGTNLDNAPFGCFTYCSSLKNVDFKVSSDYNNDWAANFTYNYSLVNITLPQSTTRIELNIFANCISLQNFTIPATVNYIGNGVFNNCYSLSEVHCQPTIPPELGSNSFSNIAPDYIIYVPVGTGDTYKAASGWSTYANHILEEGQTPNRMMLAKFNEETDEPQDDMR